MNEIILSGTIDKYEIDHIIKDVTFYKAFIRVGRSVLPVIAREKDKKIGAVTFMGQLRSYNRDGHVITYVLLDRYITNTETNTETNICRLHGTICIKSTPRTVILAINRAYGKTAYIPCVSESEIPYSVGQDISIIGSFQSRYHRKKCYEVVIKEVQA